MSVEMEFALDYVARAYQALSGWLYDVFNALSGFEQLVLILFCAAVCVRMLLMPLMGAFALPVGIGLGSGSDGARSDRAQRRLESGPVPGQRQLPPG